MDSLLGPLLAKGSPFELEFAENGIAMYRHAPSTLPDLYARAKGRARARDATLLVSGEHRLSLREIFTGALAVSTRIAAIQREGAPFRRIAIVIADATEWATAMVAVTDMGCAAALIPPCRDARQAAGFVAAVGCDAVVTDRHMATSLQNMLPYQCKMIVLEQDGSGALPVAPTSDPADSLQGHRRPHPDDEAIIAFSSGSTGTPKGIVLSHRGVVTGLWNMMLSGTWSARRNAMLAPAFASSPATGTPASMLCSSLMHIGGYSQLLLMLAVSGKVVVMEAWDVQSALAIVQRENVKSLIGATPAMIREFIDACASKGATELSLDSFSIHGAALRRRLMEDILKAFPRARVGTGYGLTETNGSIAAISGAELWSRPYSSGPVVPTAQILIANAEGNSVKSGATGEICVRGPMLMTGYCRQGNAKSQVEGNWYHTGDIGKLDAQGYLHVLGRRKDALHIGSGTIYCSEIEQILDEWHSCQESVAQGVEGGSLVVIGLIPNAGEDLDTDDLARRLGERFEAPADRLVLITRSDLPRTSSGKLDRQYLFQLWNRRNSSVLEASND